MPTKRLESSKKIVMGKGNDGFTIGIPFKQSKTKIWKGLTRAKHINQYFCQGAKGDFTPELTHPIWAWKKWGSIELHHTKYEKEKLIEFHWEGYKVKYHITVRFEIVRENNKTMVRISERGWKKQDLKHAFGECEGWTVFLCYLKFYLKYGKDPRKI